ncbi:hypothetical protein VNO77_21806 [Canavalia gladiata]|uniref:Uncharacterized protein n=1 Tax=Canavalia gladiata TaxID=3824 RepID=A0AAN9L4P1_CANGL
MCMKGDLVYDVGLEKILAQKIIHNDVGGNAYDKGGETLMGDMIALEADNGVEGGKDIELADISLLDEEKGIANADISKRMKCMVEF